MGWILGIDVRDGQRIAFPEFSCAISYDLTHYKGKMVEQVSTAQSMCEKIKRAITSGEVPTGEGVSEALANFEDRIKSCIRAEKLVEGMIIFDGSTWPLRAMRFTEDWAEVRQFISGGSVLDTDPLQELMDELSRLNNDLSEEDSDSDESG